MHDLRKKVLLESGKTMSKKAKARPESAFTSPVASPRHSPKGSRQGSRAGSRYASEDEFHNTSDGDLDDSMTVSTISDDEEGDVNTTVWMDRLTSCIDQLLASRTRERKRMANMEREDMLQGYLHLIRHHYAMSQIAPKGGEIMGALLHAVKNGSVTTERRLALLGISVTTLTYPTEQVYEQAEQDIKNVIEGDESSMAKMEGIAALAVAATYGDGSEAASRDTLQYFLDIIASDGDTINALDDGAVAITTLRSWAFVASHLDDLTEEFDEAMEAFVEQLDSSEAGVQSAAGMNIALLFENARDHEEETGEKVNVKYDAHKLVAQMRELAKGSKGVSRKDRRMLKADFTSIVTSLERGKGPGYSTSGWPTGNPNEGGTMAESDKGGDVVEFGYRQIVWVGTERVIVDSWAMSANLEFLKSVLAGGLSTHMAKNPTVRDMLT